MTKRIAVFSTLMLLGVVCMNPVLSAQQVGVAGGDKVQTQTLADTSAIVPGKSFLVGFKFTIEPNWHIYWKNPGDSGLATQIKLSLPDGFTAGELMFPTPTRLALAGDILNYAYENDVMLMVRISPPKDISVATSVKIGAKASWLVCQEECVPGRAEMSIDLPVAQTATAANSEEFKQWTDQLPVTEDTEDVASSAHSLAIANGEGQGSISITWKKTPSDAQFIPGPLKDGDTENIKSTTTGDSTKITFTIKNFKGIEPVTGLVVFTSPSGVKRGLEVSIPTSTADAH